MRLTCLVSIAALANHPSFYSPLMKTGLDSDILHTCYPHVTYDCKVTTLLNPGNLTKGRNPVNLDICVDFDDNAFKISSLLRKMIMMTSIGQMFVKFQEGYIKEK